MNLVKSYEFFQPEKVKEPLHIIGCGSVGSTVAENLARSGLTDFVLWDFDTVEEKNIVNQMFRSQDVGKSKVEALRDIISEINPDAAAKIKLMPEGWNGELLDGYVFLAVDSIEIRKQIVQTNNTNPNVVAMFDFRTALTFAQHYATDWASYAGRKQLIESMDFSSEEVTEEVTACGTTLGVATTVRLISALGVNNFINFVKGNELKKFVQIDGFSFMLDAF